MHDIGISPAPRAVTAPLPKPPAPAPAPVAPPAAPAAKPIADQRDGVKGASALNLAASADMGPLPFPDAPANKPNPYATQIGGHGAAEAVTGGAPAGATEVIVTESCKDQDAVQAGKTDSLDDPWAEKALMRDAQRTAEAVAQLPPDQAAQYQSVRTAAQSSGVADAATALDNLVRNGRMTPEMLASFAGMVQGPNCERATRNDPNGINRVIGETLRQVDKPTSIVQDPEYKTCSEAAVEFKMASENPTQYVQMIKDMVSANDYARLGDGSAVPLAQYGLDNADASGRSFTSAMFQQSLHARFSDGDAAGPIPSQRMEWMLDAAFPGHADGGLTTVGPDQALTATQALEPGAIALIDIPGQDAKHAVTVMSNEGGQITFFDSHGEGAIMTADADDFAGHLRGATLPPGTGVTDTQENFPVAGETAMMTTTTAPVATKPRR